MFLEKQKQKPPYNLERFIYGLVLVVFTGVEVILRQKNGAFSKSFK